MHHLFGLTVRVQIYLDSVEQDVLMVPAVIADVVAQRDVVKGNDLSLVQGAVLSPVHRHPPADGLLLAGHCQTCNAQCNRFNDLNLVSFKSCRFHPMSTRRCS